MSYQPLSKLFYMDTSNERFEHNQELAKQRLAAESSFRTGIIADYGEFFLAVPRDLSVLNETVLRQERDVALALDQLPPIARGALIRSLVISEVVCTNELEGIHSTKKQINDLLESAELATSATLESKRFRELARLYLELSENQHTRPASPEDVRSIYNRIMSGEDLGDNAPDGELFRKGGVDIIGPGGQVIHTGLTPESKIISALGKTISLASSLEIPETYSAIIAHYLFEYIHPFYDGNGRTGRYLLALYLSQPLSILTVLSLSRAIAENREPYYRAFKEAEHTLNHAELTGFVMCILEYVSTAQQRIIAELSSHSTKFNTMKERLDGLCAKASLQHKECDLLFLLAQYALFGAFPDVPLELMSSYLGLKRQMTRKYTRLLEEKGLIKAVSSRPLRFVLTEMAEKDLGLREQPKEGCSA